MKSLVGYVKILHVPTSYTFKDLSAKLLTAKLPVSVKQLIYLSGMPEAVLVCSSSQGISIIQLYTTNLIPVTCCYKDIYSQKPYILESGYLERNHVKKITTKMFHIISMESKFV